MLRGIDNGPNKAVMKAFGKLDARNHAPVEVAVMHGHQRLGGACQGNFESCDGFHCVLAHVRKVRSLRISERPSRMCHASRGKRQVSRFAPPATASFSGRHSLRPILENLQ